MYALIKNNIVEKYPYTLRDFKDENPRVTLPYDPSDAVLNSFGIFYVEDTPRPETDFNQVVEETTPVFSNGAWRKSWAIRQANSQEADTQKSILVKKYDDALRDHFNKKAAEKRYDNFITCSLRAGYSGPFQQEGIAFAEWMDQCNYIGYQTIAQVESGQINIPTIEEFINSLPQLVWPN